MSTASRRLRLAKETMTKGQKAFGGFVLLAVAYSALHYYLFEVVVWGVNAS